ncbi:pimeloyl-ACP methyl ester esterase BioH [Neptuniibacter marinus]|uniref:pimeloyl-ACP methyl ester esterase BioH n=1 Tax=Neptuniibacter marinus TaxID=1806670 RepID=UPI00082ED694|nr:pimeloyl-ACP methyl ester esterase BioH [Neptuniibacter marinus]
MSLYVERYENNGKPELVLLHGWGMDSQVWGAFAEQLSSSFSLTLIDLPGLGRSTAFPEPYTADAVVELLGEHAPKAAAWLGWSMGGQLAIEFAARYPERVTCLITVASSPCFVQRSDWSCAMDEETHGQFEQALEVNVSKTLQRFIMLQTQGAEAGRDTLKSLKLILKNLDHTGARESLQLLRDDVRDQLSNLSMPIMQLFGEKDLLVPSEAAQACERLSKGLIKVYEGAGHLPFYSHQAEVAADVTQFVQESIA